MSTLVFIWIPNDLLNSLIILNIYIFRFNSNHDVIVLNWAKIVYFRHFVVISYIRCTKIGISIDISNNIHVQTIFEINSYIHFYETEK